MASTKHGAISREEMQEQTRRVVKAYLKAPIETRHLAARLAAADYGIQRIAIGALTSTGMQGGVLHDGA